MLEYLLYSKKLREKIADLKAKGDFREEGMNTLNWTIIIVPVCLIIILVVIIHFDGLSELAFSMSVIFAAITWLAVKGKQTCILTYSTGKLTEGTIASAIYYPFPMVSYGWEISYTYYDHYGNFHQNVFKRGTKRIVGSVAYKKFQKIAVYYDQSHPNNSLPYFPNVFKKYCISWQALKLSLKNSSVGEYND